MRRSISAVRPSICSAFILIMTWLIDDLLINTSCPTPRMLTCTRLADSVGHFSCCPCFPNLELCTLTKVYICHINYFDASVKSQFGQLSSIPGMWSAPGYSGSASVGNLKLWAERWIMFIFMGMKSGAEGARIERAQRVWGAAGITWADLKQCAGTAKLCRSQILEEKV